MTPVLQLSMKGGGNMLSRVMIDPQVQSMLDDGDILPEPEGFGIWGALRHKCRRAFVGYADGTRYAVSTLRASIANAWRRA